MRLKRDPQNAEVYADRGYSFYLQQKWPEAEQNLRRALQLDSSLGRAHNNLGLLLARTGRQDEALMEFQLAGCSEAECRTNLVHSMMLDQRWNEARQQCDIALASHSVPADVKKRLKRLDSVIVKAQHQSQSPPQAQFPPGAGQPALPHGLPVAATQVSYESAQNFRALPPVTPASANPLRLPSAGMFNTPPSPAP